MDEKIMMWESLESLFLLLLMLIWPSSSSSSSAAAISISTLHDINAEAQNKKTHRESYKSQNKFINSDAIRDQRACLLIDFDINLNFRQINLRTLGEAKGCERSIRKSSVVSSLFRFDPLTYFGKCQQRILSKSQPIWIINWEIWNLKCLTPHSLWEFFTWLVSRCALGKGKGGKWNPGNKT